MERLAFQPTFFGLATPPVIELASKLATMLPGPINHFQFTSGGAESNETAFKIARYYWSIGGQPEKVKIISRQMGYHGIAMGTLAATGIPGYWQHFGPRAPGFLHVSAPYAYRNGEGMSEAEFVQSLVKELEETIEREGAETIAAFIGEPVQGAGGVVVPPDGYWPAICAVLKKHDILFIADEVINGFGRTGTMFGVQQYGVQPDIVAMAKGITSGYVPLGAVGVTDEIYERMIEPDTMFMHGFTYSGHPVACFVALRNLAIIEEENLPANAAARGKQLLGGLRELQTSPECRQCARQGDDGDCRDRRGQGDEGALRRRLGRRQQTASRDAQARPDRPLQRTPASPSRRRSSSPPRRPTASSASSATRSRKCSASTRRAASARAHSRASRPLL